MSVSNVIQILDLKAMGVVAAVALFWLNVKQAQPSHTVLFIS
jgi:hypothetical protein